MIIADAKERLLALDPNHSFIVQAPAGSGKTELLTQRFLVLLGMVNHPEEILAMTFTRKSAAEMRARIILALQSAEMGTPPETAHGKKTWELAKKVLRRDNTRKWNLLTNPHRLRIQTLDAFNSTLTRQLPILSGFGASPDIAPQPIALYRSAVRELLSHLELSLPWSEAIATLLKHLDNQPEKAEALLIKLLQRRDQWLPYIALTADDAWLRKALEQQLLEVINDILKNIYKEFPAHLHSEILTVANFAANQLHQPILEQFPNDRESWLRLRELFFTKEDEWRKAFNKNTGFPPENKPMKQRVLALVQMLSENSALKNAFRELHYAPNPTFEEAQWEMLAALRQVLHLAVSELRLSFQKHKQIDYTENALAALSALGHNNAPTDLSLALDYQIKHLLVDEFQDTSATQYRLLEKLTLGWEKGDGRTLFLVGDPMQSIYRFREAEVGLFIRARKIGIGPLPLKFLQLSVNFRSRAGIVEWVNQHFPLIFSPFDDIATGAVSYSQAIAANEDKQNCVELFPQVTKSQQGQKIVSLIQRAQTENPEDSIAILVRSRNHLSDILPALKQANMAWCAIGIDPLIEKPLIQDLMSLTRALLDLNDRIAWLAILRAPWCGLTLADLLKISGGQADVPIWKILTSQPDVSDSAKICLTRIIPILSRRINHRKRFTLRYQVESTWLLLGGPACCTSIADLKEADNFFKLLDTFKSNTPTIDSLQEAVEALYAMPDPHLASKIQIMTIHNAKGLEFDTVIVPHLEKRVTGDKKQLMLWMERPSANEKNALLIAPLAAVGKKTDPIYDYIRREEEIRNRNEQSRLLYVAVTRAKKNLHLLFDVEKNKNPEAGSLLSRLWPAIKDSINLPEKTLMTDHILTETAPFLLKRLPTHWQNPLQEVAVDDATSSYQAVVGFQLIDPVPRQIGIVTHTLLQMLCEHGQHHWEGCADQEAWITQQLKQVGMRPKYIPDALVKIQHAIATLLTDPRGQWIIFPHKEAQSEFNLTTQIDARPASFIIDRTFVDENNIRWIIDFKTATCDSAAIPAFLEIEKTRYAKQMQQYRIAMQGFDNRPIRLGLYFPLLPEFCEI